MEFKAEDIVFWKNLPKGVLNQHVLWKSKKQNGLILRDGAVQQTTNLLNYIETEYWGINQRMLNDYMEFTFRQLSFEEKLMGFWIKPKKMSPAIEELKKDLQTQEKVVDIPKEESEVKLVLNYTQEEDEWDYEEEFKTNSDKTLITSPNQSFVKPLDGYSEDWKPEIFDQDGNALCN